jgi:predicted membrane metal-binding protein
LLAGLFSTLFIRLLGARRRFLAAGLSALAIAVYAVLVGGIASVVRAVLMGGLGLFARQIGRRQDGLNSLAFVGAVMAAFNP